MPTAIAVATVVFIATNCRYPRQLSGTPTRSEYITSPSTPLSSTSPRQRINQRSTKFISLVDILVVVVAPAMTAVMGGGGGGRERQGGRRRRQQQQQRQAWRWRRRGGLQGDRLWPLDNRTCRMVFTWADNQNFSRFSSLSLKIVPFWGVDYIAPE